jgi:predicted DNA-binding transcriptional regulator AlpA
MALVSLSEVAEMLGMTSSGAHRLIAREPTFPAPVALLTGRFRAWDRGAVEQWVNEHRGTGSK